MEFNIENLYWIRKPKNFNIQKNRVEITTEPGTDLWQRTYYGFQNDNAPALLMKCTDKYFSFTVKTEFESKHRFDQCGIIIYQDSDNWCKASIEFENEKHQRLGSVVTNRGFSDWATTDIPVEKKIMYYRLSRRDSDYCFENSMDGIEFNQMRIFHLEQGQGEIQFGVYACSPEESSFRAIFTEFEITDCKWKEHI